VAGVVHLADRASRRALPAAVRATRRVASTPWVCTRLPETACPAAVPRGPPAHRTVRLGPQPWRRLEQGLRGAPVAQAPSGAAGRGRGSTGSGSQVRGPSRRIASAANRAVGVVGQLDRRSETGPQPELAERDPRTAAWIGGSRDPLVDPYGGGAVRVDDGVRGVARAGGGRGVGRLDLVHAVLGHGRPPTHHPLARTCGRCAVVARPEAGVRRRRRPAAADDLEAQPVVVHDHLRAYVGGARRLDQAERVEAEPGPTAPAGPGHLATQGVPRERSGGCDR